MDFKFFGHKRIDGGICGVKAKKIFFSFENGILVVFSFVAIQNWDFCVKEKTRSLFMIKIAMKDKALIIITKLNRLRFCKVVLA